MIVVGIVIFLLILVFVVYLIIKKRYISYIYRNSITVKELVNVNEGFSFKEVKNYYIENDYDNEIYYDLIEPIDYLIYKVEERKSEVKTNINNCYKNRILYEEYKKLIPSKESLGKYDSSMKVIFKRFLNYLEEKEFSRILKKPVLFFDVKVILRLTNINGRFRESKFDYFNIEELEIIINKLSKKNGYFYLDKDMWDSLCKVERGKVTNKMRFYIYQRDGYRCRYCGRRTNDLEIDHIFPIAKGGKTVINNLQTLCHSCNYKKSDNVY